MSATNHLSAFSKPAEDLPRLLINCDITDDRHVSIGEAKKSICPIVASTAKYGILARITNVPSLCLATPWLGTEMVKIEIKILWIFCFIVIELKSGICDQNLRGDYELVSEGKIPGTSHEERVIVQTATGSSIDHILSFAPQDDDERTNVDLSKVTLQHPLDEHLIHSDPPKAPPPHMETQPSSIDHTAYYLLIGAVISFFVLLGTKSATCPEPRTRKHLSRKLVPVF